SDRACKYTGKRRSLARVQTNNPGAHRCRWGCTCIRRSRWSSSWCGCGRRTAVIVRCEEVKQTRVRAVGRRKAKRFKWLIAEGVSHLADTAKRSVHHNRSPVVAKTNILST